MQRLGMESILNNQRTGRRLMCLELKEQRVLGVERERDEGLA